MNSAPTHCQNCGCLLKRIGQEPWEEILKCLKCFAKFRVTFGDAMGGGPYCHVAEISAGKKPVKNKRVKTLLKKDSFFKKYELDKRPRSAFEFVQQALDGSEHDRGELEAMAASIQKIRLAIGKISELLYERKIITKADIYKIADEPEP